MLSPDSLPPRRLRFFDAGQALQDASPVSMRQLIRTYPLEYTNPRKPLSLHRRTETMRHKRGFAPPGKTEKRLLTFHELHHWLSPRSVG